MNERGISALWIRVMVLFQMNTGCIHEISDAIEQRQNVSPPYCAYYNTQPGYAVHFAQKQATKYLEE